MIYPYSADYQPPPGPVPDLDVRRLAVDPMALAVTLGRARLFLRADSQDEDDTILDLIRAANDWFEVRTGISLVPMEYECLARNICGNALVIPRSPIRNVHSVEYWDCDGDEWTALTGDTFQFEARARDFAILFDRDALNSVPMHWAPTGYQLKIQFAAGYDGESAPQTSAAGPADDGMIQCVKTLIALGFQKREEATDAEKDMICRRYRKFW